MSQRTPKPDAPPLAPRTDPPTPLSGVRSSAPASTPPAPSVPQLPSLARIDPVGRASMLAPIGRYGRFELLGRLAYGGMAEIFLARETAQAFATRELVVKRIVPHVADDPAFVQMFLDEARLAMRLVHPNICHIYEFGQQDGTWFIAMEWVNGVPLGKVIKRARAAGGVPPQVSARIIGLIAEALGHAHAAVDEHGRPLGLVHRDVSPQNIMVSYEGAVKLLDFGIAKVTSQPTRTAAGMLKGKFGYMSPEQCQGGALDGRSDVFSLGVCLFEALTARNLYRRGTEYETMKAIIEEAVPSARAIDPRVPEALDKILQHALAKRPEDRFQSAGEMQEAIEQWLADEHQVVNAKRIAELLQVLFREEIERGPIVDSSPQAPTLPVAAVDVAAAAAAIARASAAPGGYEIPIDVSGQSRPPPAPRRRARSGLPVVVAAVVGVLLVLVAGVIAIWLATGGLSPETPVATTAAPARTPSPSPSRSPSPSPSPIPSPTPSPPSPSPIGAVVASTQPSQELGVPDGVPTTSGPSTPRPSTPAREGTLSLNTRPWSKVYAGSRLLGTTPIGAARVPAGSVRLRLVDRDGTTHHRVVRVEAGHEAEAFFDLSQPD